MDDAEQAGPLRLDEAGLRMNCRAILRRLEFLRGGKGRLRAAGPHAALVESAATDAGWVTDAIECDVLLWFAPGSSFSEAEIKAVLACANEAQLLCLVGEGAPEAGDRFTIFATRSFRAYRTLDHWFGEALEATGLAPGVQRTVRKVWGWTGSAVGARFCAVPLKGTREFYFHRSDIPAPVAQRGGATRLRDALLTLGGIGRFPLIAATLASFLVMAAALVCAPFLGGMEFRLLFLALAAVSTAGCVLLEPWAEAHYLAKDPREVVLDEVAGMSVALAFLPAPPTLVGIIVCFGLFRFFDVLKPGIHWLEKFSWRGIVVWDDLLAGVYAGVVCALGVRFLGM